MGRRVREWGEHVWLKYFWVRMRLLGLKILAFTLFHAFAILHGKLYRMGKVTFQELRKRIYRSLFCGQPLRLFSG